MERELIQGVRSIKDLSAREVFDRIGGQDRSGKVKTVTAISCRVPEVAAFLRRTYDYSPEEGTDVLTHGFSTFLARLPDEYTLDVWIRKAEKYRNEPESLKIHGFIFSNEAAENARTEMPQSLSYERYMQLLYAERFDDMHASSYAGRFGFWLFTEELPESNFQFLMSTNTKIGRPQDFIRKTERLAETIFPVPLRYSEGNRTGVSDGVRLMQEEIIHDFAEDTNAVGVVFTTPPTLLGSPMLARQGYKSILDLDGSRLESSKLVQTETYKSLVKEEAGNIGQYTMKVVSTP